MVHMYTYNSYKVHYTSYIYYIISLNLQKTYIIHNMSEHSVKTGVQNSSGLKLIQSFEMMMPNKRNRPNRTHTVFPLIFVYLLRVLSDTVPSPLSPSLDPHHLAIE